jgi:DNA polymerase I
MEKEEEMKGVEGQKEGREAPSNLPLAYLLSAGYDGKRQKALLKLYDPESEEILLWYDNTGHLPYCYSKQPVEELKKNKQLSAYPGLLRLEPEKRLDALRDEWIEATKIVASNPLDIGGEGKRGIRNLLEETWESQIVYYQNYIFDRQLNPGMPYRIIQGSLEPMEYKLSPEVASQMEGLFRDEDPELRDYMREWALLLQCPVPRLRRVAVDIEVYQLVATRIPDPEVADQPIIAASFVSSDGLRRVLLLKEDLGEAPRVEGAEVVCFESERDLVADVFKVLDEYPIVLTFNGDDFDLKYLRKRAQNLGVNAADIPIIIGRRAASLRYGMHIDLYLFFLNHSIQIYAFGNRYRENTLQDVTSSILGKGKLSPEEGISGLSYEKLAEYCLRDSELTYELTSINDDLVMKLIVILSRISKMTLEDVTRSGVSRWILALMRFEHRRREMLIPNPEDILKTKGVTSTEAVIKGKKYKGAIVRDPKPGVHFSVTVLDFASLYPAIIRNWNLSYETILCPHPECRENKVPGTPHWVCTRHRGLSSLIIGSLRDLRVSWYKPLSKDRALPKEERAWYDVIQNALKVFLNASYGVFGSESFDLYCPPLAESTAAVGRYAMTSTMDEAEKLGISVLYGDTDSVFLEDPSEEQIGKLVDWTESGLKIEFDVDKVYRYAVFSKRKKNYLGVYPDGSIDAKGLTGKKRHVPPLLKDAFTRLTEILGGVKSPEDFERAREDIRRLVNSVYLRLRNKEFDLREITFNVMMGQSLGGYETNPQHVKAAKLLEERGIKLGAGDVISYVVTQDSVGVKPIQLASKKDVAVAKYVEYLRSMFEQILDALDLSFDDLVGKTTLDKFFGG